MKAEPKVFGVFVILSLIWFGTGLAVHKGYDTETPAWCIVPLIAAIFGTLMVALIAVEDEV